MIYVLRKYFRSPKAEFVFKDLVKRNSLELNSVVLAKQIRIIDKSKLKEKIGHIDDTQIIGKVSSAIGISFGLGE